MARNFNWAVGPRFDIPFLLLSMVLPFVFLAIYYFSAPWMEAHFTMAPEVLFFIFFTGLFDAPHIFQTFLRTHFDKREFARKPVFHNLILLCMVTISLLSVVLGYFEEFVFLLGLYGGWHILRQNLGFLKIYQKKSDKQTSLSVRLNRALLYLTWGYFLVHEKNSLNDWIVGVGLSRQLLQVLDGVLMIVLVGLLLVSLFNAFKNSTTIDLPQQLFLYGQVFSFLLFAFLQVPFLVIIAVATISHTLQYMGWIKHFAKLAPIGPQKVRLFYRATWGIGLLLILINLRGGAQASLFGLSLSIMALYNGFVLWHYFIDGRIWRFGRQPELSKLLS